MTFKTTKNNREPYEKYILKHKNMIIDPHFLFKWHVRNSVYKNLFYFVLFCI